MTVRRGSFYAGVFLVAAGGVAVLDAVGALDTVRVADALVVLWPLALIAIGVGLALRRSPAALPAGIIAAMVPGLALGGAMVAGPRLPDFCTDIRPVNAATDAHEGSFGSNADVELTMDCGRLDVTTQPGSTWRLDSREAGSVHRTQIEAGAGNLTADSSTNGRAGLHAGQVDWSVVLPTGPTTNLHAQVNAGRGSLALAQAQLGDVNLAVNAGELDADFTGATLNNLDVSVNAGKATVTLPATASFQGTLDANAGALAVCAPEPLGLRVQATATLGSATVNGLVRSGDAWVTPGYDTAQYKADLTVHTSVGSVTINPQGGCK